jgi:hypothetical protein
MEAPPPPPPGTNFLAVIRPSLDDILIAHTFTVILIPLLISLFYFSTPALRTHPIFILNVIAISLALAVGGLLDARAVCSFSPFKILTDKGYRDSIEPFFSR